MTYGQWIGITVMALLVLAFLFPFVLCLIDRIKGTAYSCSMMGWHNGKGGGESHDGCSAHAICSKCGKHVMQDSQGNWF